jgi:hypothetical protein
MPSSSRERPGKFLFYHELALICYASILWLALSSQLG